MTQTQTTTELDLDTCVESLTAMIADLGKDDGPGETGGLAAWADKGRIVVGDEAVQERFDADETGFNLAYQAVRDWTW